MKKILLLLVVIFSAGILVALADNEKIIDKSQLPAQAQQFIDAHFASSNIVYAKEESCVFFFSSYEVKLSDSAKLEFSGDGEWEEVDCRFGEVPVAIIPQAIKEYVDNNHPGEKVLMIEKERNGYEVKLSNRLELKFNDEFKIYDIDD